ncbi:hypothetical protein RJD11_09825 [Bacillus velezensis]|uniref:hypothetical protein n=1 Tax=Bacillus TaxID=1386 RepID=UPI001C52C8EB|nr:MULTISPECIES: hypothetical protein [Bacillus amyloliquefaciens group]QXP98970.1 hypothetical protein KVY05_09740 [Bacillus velezensis]UHH04798.1 hypothetical protein LUA14_09785 [Bacillus amyloliquefaciens]ULR24525.1 hypothetical protein MJE83_09785 [Bacillus velezensis]UVW11335.1 hypothetical protein NX856_09820 [Bacillus velezensis]WHL78672.1 hypothetical protein QLH34_09805 [Bacillus velezensis]
MKLIGIKTNNCFLVSDNIEGKKYFHSQLDELFFDGKRATETYKSDWFKLDKEPSVIEKQMPAKKINHRYELKEGFQETDLTPQVINVSYIDEESEYYEVKGLYDLKFEEVPQQNEKIEFEMNVIEEIDGELKLQSHNFNLNYNLLDRIQTHPMLLETKPCHLSREESYKIIRNHIKANINPKLARVTSDYDFCFTVVKVLELYKPHEYVVDLNAMYKRRKPKLEKRFQTKREVEIYNVAPKAYQSYPIVEPFSGKDVEDLKSNIKKFLDDLMAKINEPLVECECCKGRGVILNEY